MMRLESKVEKEIEHFVSYIRRMNSIQDDGQLELLIQISITRNPDAYTSIGVDIPGHITFIRQMGLQTDAYLRDYLRKQIVVNQDPVFTDILTNSSKKRAIKEMKEVAKDFRSNPTKFARRVDAEFRS